MFNTNLMSLFATAVILLFFENVAANTIILGNNSGVVTIDGKTISSDCVQGNGVMKTATRDVVDFDKIELNGVFDVLVTSGENTSFQIQGEENIIDLIASDVSSSTLTVFSQKSICPKQKLTLTISVKDLSALSAYGAMTVEIKAIANDNLSLTVDGSAGIRATGTSDNLYASISGTGNIETAELVSQNAKISISGIGDATVQTSGVLDVAIQGVGNVYYLGKPNEVRQNITGVGSVTPR